MRICICVSWYFPQSVGGTETYVNALAVFLQEGGHTVTILKPGEKNEESYFYNKVEVVSFYPGKDFPKKMYLGIQPPAIADFEEKLRGLEPDVVHFHSLTGPSGITVFHVQAARLLTSRVYFTFHLPHLTCATSTFRHLQKQACDGVALPQKCAACVLVHKGWPVPAAGVMAGISSALHQSHVSVLGINILTGVGGAEWIDVRREQLGLLTESCDRLICLSSWFVEVLVANGVPLKKIAFIEQGLLMNIDKPAVPILPGVTKKTGPVRLVFLGRLHPIKGLSLLLSVIQGFDQSQYTLDLYGPIEAVYGEQLESVFRLPHIHYRGPLAHKEVLATLSQYDALIVPSTVTEMAPLVIQEAFAAKIPAIASDVAGNAAFVKPGINGWLFRSGSAASLQERLQWLLDHREQLATIQDTITTPRSIREIGQEHLQLYKS